MGDSPLSRRTFLSAAGAAGIAGLTAPLLSACGTSGPSGGGGGGKKTLQAWVLQDDGQNPIQQASLDDFNKSSSTKIKLVEIPNSGSSGYTDKLRIGMGSPNPPDLLFNWGTGSIQDYAASGRLVDLTSQLNSDPTWKSAWIPSVLDAGKAADGKYYGIPMRGMQPVLLFYNKTLFAQHGQKPPATYDDLLKLVTYFDSQKIQPFALGHVDAWPNLMWLEYLVERLGGPSVFADILAGKPNAWSNPVVLDALHRIQDLVDRRAFGTNFASVNYVNDGAGLLFAKGKAAMHLMGTWEYSNQVDKHPDFAKNDLAFAPFPTITGGKGDPNNVVGNPTNYYSISRKSKDVNAAISFLKKEMSSQMYIDKLIKAGDVPAATGLEARLAASPGPEFAKYVYQMVQKAPSFTLSWDQALPSRFTDPLHNNLQKVFLKKMTPEKFTQVLGQVK
ncbi:ABC transporter substrate-binding protein [Actinoallomurus rhizosphaericola]|uniref:ABC transporter substrate-binding protein n=1 Tax=Actinoallomurus rhizosphaericola TaxID=2952536 RepID=UPI0020921C88|nr:extracellular solute-binding protein [Actinoallomurus rhizosphaericola]MCO5997519.1 extracellular solute-binding protein [Actinoallomurus rhizosphaericola]